MKNSSQIIIILILLIILIFLSNSIIRSCSSTEIPHSNFQTFQLSTDTVYSKPDTVLLTDTITVHKLTASLDTVYLDDTTKVVSASADTTITKDSLNLFVQYFFPPLNYFQIDFDFPEKIITKTKTITEIKEFEKPIPFYKNHWFWSTVGLIILLINNVVQ